MFPLWIYNICDFDVGNSKNLQYFEAVVLVSQHSQYWYYFKEATITHIVYFIIITSGKLQITGRLTSLHGNLFEIVQFL